LHLRAGHGSPNTIQCGSTVSLSYGTSERTDEAHDKKLAAVYEEGDEISVIGFSRGSSAARELAVWLNEGRPEFDNKVVPSSLLAVSIARRFRSGKT